MDLNIKPLSPDLLDYYLYFFDNMTFGDHPHWSACYCYSFHFTGKDEDWTRDRNRVAVTDRILDGRIKGYLAFKGNLPIGWCNVNNKTNYEALSRWHPEIEPGPEKTCSIVCFLIHPEYRGKGIAGKLLETIIIDYRNSDITYIEAYPGKYVNNSEGHYKGPLNMFLKQGFEIEKEYGNFFVVRKELKV